jgi:glycosyltransferase involved in cell wall biosynthesis
MKEYKVTVYITNHNYEKYLKQSIESVLNQNFKNFELIIIDDGSTDNSKKIINEYESYSNVSIIYQRRRGLNVSNNVAIRLSRGEYIIRLDADDWLEKNALKTLSSYLDTNKDVVLVFPDYFVVDEEGNIINRIKRHNFNKVTLFDQPAHGACTLIRKKYLKEVGMYDENFFCQDGYDIWIRLTHKYKVGNINKPLFYYRQHGNNLTYNHQKILKTRFLITKKFIKKKLKSNFFTVGIIPVRGKILNNDSVALRKLKSKPLILHIINNALNSKLLSQIVITSPDKVLLTYLKKTYKNKIECILRDQKLGALSDVIRKMKKKGKKFDALMELSIRTPFFSGEDIDNAINTIRLFSTDILIGVTEDNSEFFQHTGKGLRPIRNSEVLRLEKESMYKKSPAFNLITMKAFRKKLNFYSDVKIGHILMDEKSSFYLSNEISWKIANKIL